LSMTYPITLINERWQDQISSKKGKKTRKVISSDLEMSSKPATSDLSGGEKEPISGLVSAVI
jgi:hypothetical protein